MVSRFDNRTNKYTYSLRFNTRSLYKKDILLFYKSGKKIIPDNFNQIITPCSLAVWFMDDGGRGGNNKNGVVIDCSNYMMSDIIRVQDTLYSLYSIKTSVHKGHASVSKKLFVLKESAYAFKDLLSPYIVESMEYKLSHIV